MLNFVLIAIILVIAGAAAFYLYRAKKRGEACVGCPHAKLCGGTKCGGGCGGQTKDSK